MIKSIYVVNHLGETVSIPISGSYELGVAILSIGGLGPVKANVSTTDLSYYDGVYINSTRLGQRNITLALRFLETAGNSIEDIRQKVYKWFPVKQQIIFGIETDNRSAFTSGYVESNDPTIFSKNEGAAISVVCPDPYFYHSEQTEVIFTGAQPLFEFPFENPSLTEPLIEFSTEFDRTDTNIVYDGDSNTGIAITADIHGDVSNLTIYNASSRENMAIDDTKLTAKIGSGLKQGDVVTINTEKGSKSVTLSRDGNDYNILSTLAPGYSWLTLSRGNNVIAYTAASGIDNVNLKVEYANRYDGV